MGIEVIKHSLLIVKENREYCLELSEFFKSTGLFEVLDCAHDGASALQSIEKYSPEILLIDVILPNIDGLDVLTKINLTGQSRKMKVIAFSAFMDTKIVSLLQNLGVEYVIHTPATKQTVLSRVLDFAVQDQGARALADLYRTKSNIAYRDEVIAANLRYLQMPHNLNGYQQLKTAIAYVVEQGNKQLKITQDVYEYVAAVHDTLPKRVERNIRTAIETTWAHGNISAQHKLFGYTVNENKGRPTNKEFIAMIAEKVRLKLMLR